MTFVVAVAVFVTASVTDVTERDAFPVRPASQSEACPDHRRGLAFYRDRHRHWTGLRGAARSRAGRAPRSCADARHLALIWRKRARAVRVVYLRERARRVALYAKWRCIHEHEGAWNANTGNGYYGGLQMDMTFQRTYGAEFLARWGTADRWPVWAQLETAERAYQSGRGFGPWPNTARMCGLL